MKIRININNRKWAALAALAAVTLMTVSGCQGAPEGTPARDPQLEAEQANRTDKPDAGPIVEVDAGTCVEAEPSDAGTPVSYDNPTLSKTSPLVGGLYQIAYSEKNDKL